MRAKTNRQRYVEIEGRIAELKASPRRIPRAQRVMLSDLEWAMQQAGRLAEMREGDCRIQMPGRSEAFRCGCGSVTFRPNEVAGAEGRFDCIVCESTYFGREYEADTKLVRGHSEHNSHSFMGQPRMCAICGCHPHYPSASVECSGSIHQAVPETEG